MTIFEQVMVAICCTWALVTLAVIGFLLVLHLHDRKQARKRILQAAMLRQRFRSDAYSEGMLDNVLYIHKKRSPDV